MKHDVAIVGYGAVGRAIHGLFPDAVAYDEPKGLGTRAEVNTARYAFVCVPTPEGPGGHCDTSIVSEVVDWIAAEIIVIRSTVAVGTTDALRERTGKRIVFQPEYGPAATPDHPFNDLRRVRWAILGGDRKDTRDVAYLYQRVFNSDFVISQTDARTAELTKYMENAFLALKVAFCNEFFDIASALGVDYTELRELWLLDPRIGKSHTWVFPDNRGFGGGCLPKDLRALTATAAAAGARARLLEATLQVNDEIRTPPGGATRP